MSTSSETITSVVPGYRAGTWDIDPTHSDVSFSVRHMMVSKVKGRFSKFGGQIVTAEDPIDSTVEVTIDLSSVDTNEPNRDAHLRSIDFFDTETRTQMTYRSTAITASTDGFLLEGDLSLRGTTRQVPLTLELNGFGPDPFGGYRAGFSATGEISRKAFGVDMTMPLDGGGVVVGDKIQIALEIEAILQQPAS